jgi:thiamine-monophosphate kinase
MPRRNADRRAAALRNLLLVVVTDRGRCRGDLVASCEAAVRGGATAILLRDKDLPRAERRALARRLKSITVRYNATFLVHTDAALAREVDADGVHLDSKAGPAEVAAARRVVGPGRLVGVSTHSAREVRGAAEEGVDYAFLGPIGASRSHPVGAVLGWRRFALAAGWARIPLVAIGGLGPASLGPAAHPRSARLRVAAVDSVLAVRDPAGAAGTMLAALAEGASPGRGPPQPGEDERGVVGFFLDRLGANPDLALGPGDDAVVLRRGGLAVSTDLTVEGVHYAAGTQARSAGFKAGARALSDLAAVGAEPVGLMVGLVVRRGPAAVDRARGLEAGVCAAARAVGTRILGGDTKETGGTETLSVTAIGLVEGARALPRSGGSPGDALFVSGPIGGSIHGRHLRPRPRIAIGLALRRRRLATACIDLSDGLAADLHRLCRASGSGAIVEGPRVPVHPDARSRGGGALAAAMSDGEDYELLFAVPPEKAALVESRGVAGKRVFRIGRLVHRNAGLVVQEVSGRLAALPDEGWVHFRERAP